MVEKSYPVSSEMKKIIFSKIMHITFTKMNSQGNEFILIDLSKQNLKFSDDVIQKIIKKSEINFDQLLLIDFNNNDNINCQIFNNDGSRAYQCGNGLRAIMLYLNTKYNYSRIVVFIENKPYSVFIDDQKEITASMGVPRAFKLIDNNMYYLESFEKQNLVIDSIKCPIDFYLIELGNMHCVIVKQYTKDEKKIIINYFDEYHKNLFNLEFVDNPDDLFNLDSNHFMVSVFEAGAGWTKSCGSGATAVASLFYGLHGAQSSNKLVIIKQEGGELKIKKVDNNLLLTGPSVIEHEGMIYV